MTATKLVSFTVSPEARLLLKECVARAIGNAFRDVDRKDLEMDLSATHANGCPLDFAKLLNAPSEDFVHDVTGIRRHLDRRTGELKDHFHPRCALPAAAKTKAEPR